MIEMPRDAWRVFSQRDEPHIEPSAWTHNAARFFETAIEFHESTKHSAIVGLNGTRRTIFGRMRDEGDLRDAVAVESARGNGLYDLAERRCRVVWLIEREGPSDHSALLIAAVIATVTLGPILGVDELFGVKTAREKLEKLAAAPYR